MSNLTRMALTSMTAAALLTGVWCELQAGDAPGVIQISDASLRALPEPNPLPVTATTANEPAYVPSGQMVSWGHAGGGGGGHHFWPGFHAGVRPGRCGRDVPVVRPVPRVPVSYRRYWPDRWYGMPGGGISPKAPRAPVIYMPNDTTQLGYYYQRVPRWQPRPGMIPPAPSPCRLHNYGTYTPYPIPHQNVYYPAETTGEMSQPETEQKVAPPAPPAPADLNKSAQLPNETVRDE